jgi:hypothetical protein
MNLVITGNKDTDRPVQALMTPDKARQWAALLIRMADMVDDRFLRNVKPPVKREVPAYFLVSTNGDAYEHAAHGPRTVCGTAALEPTGGTGLPNCPNCLDGLEVECLLCGEPRRAHEVDQYRHGLFCKTHPVDDVREWVKAQRP